MPDRPQAVAFDAIGTLFSVEPLKDAVARLGLPAQAATLWLSRTLRDGFAHAASGTFRPFAEVAGGALAGLLAEHDKPIDPALVGEALDHFRRLPPRPDADVTFGRLIDAGVRVLVVTNGSEDNTRALLDAAGLLGRVERVVSIDEVRAWKPRAEVYRHAASSVGVAPGRLALVAAHAWDCHGAHQAGLLTGWAGLSERHFSPAFHPPDVHGPTLADVADALLRLPRS